MKKSSFKIASISSCRLVAGLNNEGELLPLRPHRFDTALKYGQPDILLVESVRRSYDGYWDTSSSAEPEQKVALSSVVETAHALKVPTVFWITAGHEQFQAYRKTADLFDLIACADLKSVDALVKEGRNAIYLPPCIQPVIFNPFRHLDDQSAPDLNILFDKGTDLLEFDEARSAVEGLNVYGLTLLESRHPQCDRSRFVSDNARDHWPFAFATQKARLAALKKAKAYVSCGTSTSSWVEQQWMALEAAACRLAVVHLGKLEANDLLSEVVIDCSCEDEFFLEFYRHSKDCLYRERIAHLAWRHVNEHHTFSHRIAQLCQILGLPHDWVEYPKVSVITPTYRRELLKRCVENYNGFEYPNKELVIAFNGNELPHPSELDISERNDITVTFVPGDLFAGAALNMGHQAASGEYFFRVDDDDDYGKNYILDMVIMARSINADLFGKPPSPIEFDGDDLVYYKLQSIEWTIVPSEFLEKNQFWLGGNSLSGSSQFYHVVPYNDYQYSAADTELQLSICSFASGSGGAVIALCDKFNLVARRKIDGYGHTWRVAADDIKSARTELKGRINLYI